MLVPMSVDTFTPWFGTALATEDAGAIDPNRTIRSHGHGTDKLLLALLSSHGHHHHLGLTQGLPYSKGLLNRQLVERVDLELHVIEIEGVAAFGNPDTGIALGSTFQGYQ